MRMFARLFSLYFSFSFFSFFKILTFKQAEIALESRSKSLFNTFLHLIRSKISKAELIFYFLLQFYICYF